MPRSLYSVDSYIATKRQKTSIWMVFNTVYNDVHAFKKKIAEDDHDQYLNEKYTDQEAREEFLDFMGKHFPETKLFDVFDLVDIGYIEWPYLGSIAIDADIGSDVCNALSEKYGNPFEDATVNNKVLWVMEYDEAKSMYEKRSEMIDLEFGDN